MVKNLPANANAGGLRDTGSIPGLGRSPGEADQVALVVKNPPTNTGDIDTVGSMGQKDLPEEGMAIHSSILPWRTP